MSHPVSNAQPHVLEQLLGVVARRWKTIVLMTALGSALAAFYAASLPPRFSSSATVMVRSGFAVDSMREGIETSTPEEEGQFLSQMELAKSARVARAVADKLMLEGDPAFYKRPETLLDKFLLRLPLHLVRSEKQAIAPAHEQVPAILLANVAPVRVGRTYVLAIGYNHPDPEIARKIAQAFAESFVAELKSVSDAARNAVLATYETQLAKATAEDRPALEKKYQEAVISRALPGVDGVIISDARKPGQAVAPRIPFLIAVGAIAGLALGCAIAGWRELRDRGIRDGDQLAAALRTRFVGYLPQVPAYSRSSGSSEGHVFSMPENARRSVSSPFDRFAETIRSAIVAVERGRGNARPFTIGVVSVLPGEGKTIVSANMAAQIAGQGRNVLLLDGHVRDPDLTGWLAGKPTSGVVDAILLEKPLDDCAIADAKNGVVFLPASANRSAEPAALWDRERFQRFKERASTSHDTIVIDLPALAAASDAVALAPNLDAILLVAEWGGAPLELIESVLAQSPEVSEKIAGVMLTKAKLGKLGLYASATSRAAHQYRIG